MIDPHTEPARTEPARTEPARSEPVTAGATCAILDGAAVAQRLLERTAARAARFTRSHGRRPCLATVLVGDDPSSHTYVRMKVARCRTAGIDSRRVDLPHDTSTAAAVAAVQALSADHRVDGILVQHPVPDHVDEPAVFEAIDPAKDVDGVTAASFAAMALGRPGFASCTPGGIMTLLDEYGIEVAGRHAVIVGAGPILGRPLGMLLLGREATVTYCHKATTDLAAHVAAADLVVGAAGVPGLVRAGWIKPGAVVVDAGYRDGRGDVDPAAATRAAAMTPVPGGVGPMTIATLLAQTVDAAETSVSRAA